MFDYHSALKEIERVYDYYAAHGKLEHIKFYLWEGGHTFSGNSDLYDFIMG